MSILVGPVVCYTLARGNEQSLKNGSPYGLVLPSEQYGCCMQPCTMAKVPAAIVLNLTSTRMHVVSHAVCCTQAIGKLCFEQRAVAVACFCPGNSTAAEQLLEQPVHCQRSQAAAQCFSRRIHNTVVNHFRVKLHKCKIKC